MPRCSQILLCAVASMLGATTVALGQQTAPGTQQGDYQSGGYITPETSGPQAALQPRLQKLEQAFDQWLSVQNIYTDAEVAAMKAKLQQQARAIPASELEDFIDQMEARLTILLSDEAMDARHYLSFYTEQARRKQFAPSGKMPQVFEMPVAELRQELFDFQQQRAQRAANQNTFSQLQGQQAQAIAQQQRDRQARQAQSINQARSQVAAQQQQQPRQKPQPPMGSRYAPRPLVTSEEFARHEVLRGLWAF